MSESSYSLKGKDVNYVEQTLRSYGFINIYKIPMNDLTAGIFTKPGKVEKVMIAGKKDFNSGDWFDSRASVSISYHSFKE